MGNSEQDPSPGIPAWQKSQPTTETGSSPEDLGPPATIDQARKFLQDGEVQKATRDRKVEFLKSKGVEEGVITKLLDEERRESPTKEVFQGTEQDTAKNTAKDAAKDAAEDASQPPAPTSTAPDSRAVETKEDRPPIVTYPEFLTKPARPPPLITANGFLNTLYAFGGLSTLIYGTSKFVLTPMVDSLTEARLSLHDTANRNLGELVTKLEGTVSEIPAMKKGDSAVHPSEDDEDTEYDDPTEMFHRDIGVQTSRPSSPVGGTNQTILEESASIQQARRLKELVASVKEVSGCLVTQSEDFAHVQTLLDVFKNDMDKMSYPVHDFGVGNSLYSNSGRNEQDDEIKKAKENIRRVKGVLLSARSFPAGTR